VFALNFVSAIDSSMEREAAKTAGANTIERAARVRPKTVIVKTVVFLFYGDLLELILTALVEHTVLIKITDEVVREAA